MQRLTAEEIRKKKDRDMWLYKFSGQIAAAMVSAPIPGQLPDEVAMDAVIYAEALLERLEMREHAAD